LQPRAGSEYDASMLLSEVGYARPATLEQALDVLAEYPGARALAGGQTLINVMKARAAAPDVLVDLAGIAELRGIELRPDGVLEVGPMTTYSELIDSPEARARPILGEICEQIADVQVRNRGTIGGNVCSSDPTNHLPPLFAAVGAQLTVTGVGGERTVPAGEFFLGVYMTAVQPGELLTKITIPPGRSDGFSSVTIGRDGTCIVCAAAALNGDVRVALGCVDATPVVVQAGSADADVVRAAVREAAFEPPSDVHATSMYRKQLAEVVAARAAAQAAERAAA
jgi:aerobic carbon-monoxide dehydrogenase medium subunit